MKPTPNDIPIELRAQVLEIKGRKVVMRCITKSNDIVTAEAEVIAIRVYDSSQKQRGVFGQ